VRSTLKQALALAPDRGSAQGASLLIYHRIGGGSPDELDVTLPAFVEQLGLLSGVDVVTIDEAIDRLDRHDPSPCFVLTFDDGFADVYEHAWPLLRDRKMPFTVYLASAYVGSAMRWEGATARDSGAPGLSWAQLSEMVDSGLCTVGNHTHHHVRPDLLDEAELDACTDVIVERLNVTPRHFAYTWGVPVPAMEPALRERFRSAATGRLGRNPPGTDPLRLHRVPVRRTDPASFFAAKLRGSLKAERTYAGIVGAAKRGGLRA
jgi:peptidoglycan/xylan/chitin deacetylase (PgdA/CDA1 family)